MELSEIFIETLKGLASKLRCRNLLTRVRPQFLARLGGVGGGGGGGGEKPWQWSLQQVPSGVYTRELVAALVPA